MLVYSQRSNSNDLFPGINEMERSSASTFAAQGVPFEILENILPLP